MTLRIPKRSLGDIILRLFGKKRALIFPKGQMEGKQIDVYEVGVKENFWKALLRPLESELPYGAVDYENFIQGFKAMRGE
jgi:hypothetical protein